jgi:hypothetical protein
MILLRGIGILLLTVLLAGCGAGGSVVGAEGGDDTGVQKDITAPVIVLSGDNPLYWKQGEPYAEPGATATDDTDGEVAVTISGTVDTVSEGNYTRLYRAVDHAGNEAVIGRQVVVTATAAAAPKAILFAHGYDSDRETWDRFSLYAEQAGYQVLRFDVPAKGSIEERATRLAEQIIANSTAIQAHTLISVGHSMGGLDLRYIVSLGHANESDPDDIFYRAAQKISRIYTIATPHKGTGLPGVDDASKDMTTEHMKEFNEAYPYADYKIGGVAIPLLAYRFKCGDAKVSDGSTPQQADSDDTDGVVLTSKQLFNGAPYTQTIFSGKHTEDALCLSDSEEELSRTDILEGMLAKEQESSDVKDVVFYTEGGCQGDEAGLFSSSYKAGGVSCLSSDRCSNNTIASMMLYPGIQTQTRITLYSNSTDTTTDDWMQLEIGTAVLDHPVCIDSLEGSLPAELQAKGVTMAYHPVEFGEDGLDDKVSYIEIE